MPEIPVDDPALVALYGIDREALIYSERLNVTLHCAHGYSKCLSKARNCCTPGAAQNTHNLISPLIDAHCFTSLRTTLPSC